MQFNTEWKDYEILATGDGQKLERWKNIYLLRPDPQVIWKSNFNLDTYPKLNAKYQRVGGGGSWQKLSTYPEKWEVSWRNLTFQIKPMGFKHTGLFPEQSVNWAKMIDLISSKQNEYSEPIKVLNLFAYTGGATVACTSAGAITTHVDSAKNMVETAKVNMKLSKLDNKPVRYIVDDCKKFVEREIRRGNTYDAIIMDPPSYGRGPSGEMWKIEDNLYEFVELTKKVLSDKPLFVLINSYTTGLQPGVIANILKLVFGKEDVEADEIGVPTEEGIVLPCGASGWKTWNMHDFNEN